jgi:hypothetical protein
VIDQIIPEIQENSGKNDIFKDYHIPVYVISKKKILPKGCYIVSC